MKKVKNGNIAHYSEEHLLKEYPGEISNKELLKNFDKYLRDNDPNDPTNFVIKSKYKENQDYKLLPKEAWQLLY